MQYIYDINYEATLFGTRNSTSDIIPLSSFNSDTFINNNKKRDYISYLQIYLSNDISNKYITAIQFGTKSGILSPIYGNLNSPNVDTKII